MKVSSCEFLRCANCGNKLSLSKDVANSDCLVADVKDGKLDCVDCNESFPIINGIPRFVPLSNYADNFAFQWSRFSKTQLDGYSGPLVSEDRFYAQTKWANEEFGGNKILDIGCGAGRFAEIAVATGAEVVAVDYSEAADVCLQNLGSNNNLTVIQADIYNLPFPESYFDYVYCFGVLQHTPDVKKAFLSIPQFVKPGGKLAVDLYQLKWNTYLHPRKWFRPITTRIKKEVLFNFIVSHASKLLSFNRVIRKIPFLGNYFVKLVPVADYTNVFPLTTKQTEEWAVMDSFDWLAPPYDKPQTSSTLKSWFVQADLVNIEVDKPAHMAGRGDKKLLTSI